MKPFALILAPLLSALTLAAPAFADFSSNSVSKLEMSSGTTAPLGFQLFCLQNASACRGGGSSEIPLTEALMKTLNVVNSRANRAIRPTSDRKDVWQLGVTSGDCEEYVLAKRAELIRQGVPGGALRIAAVTTRQGEGHAVLVVRTSSGDLVLDNLAAQIKQSDQISHSWVAMTAADGKTWKKVTRPQSARIAHNAKATD